MFHVNSTARPKQVAKDFVRVLKDLGHPHPYSTLLEAVARMYGHASYGMLERAAGGSPGSPDDAAAGPAVAEERRRHQVGVLVGLGVPDDVAVQAVTAVSPTGRSRRTTSAPRPLSVASEIELRLGRFADGLARLGAVAFEHGGWTGVVFRGPQSDVLVRGMAVRRDNGRLFMTSSVSSRLAFKRFDEDDGNWAREPDSPAEAVAAMKVTLDEMAQEPRGTREDHGADFGDLLCKCGFFDDLKGTTGRIAGVAKTLVEALDRDIMTVAAGSPYFSHVAYNELVGLRRTDPTGLFSFMVTHPPLNGLVTAYARRFDDEEASAYRTMKEMGALCGLKCVIDDYCDRVGIEERFDASAVEEAAAILAKTPLAAVDDIGLSDGHVMLLAHLGKRLAPKSARDWRIFAKFGWQLHDMFGRGMKLRQVWAGFTGDWSAIERVSLNLRGEHAFRPIAFSNDFTETLLLAAAREIDDDIQPDEMSFDGTEIHGDVSVIVDRLVFGQWSIPATMDAIGRWYKTPNSSGETGTIKAEFGEAERKLLPPRFSKLSAGETLALMGIEDWQDRVLHGAGLSP